jgi:hypothetical protein
MDRGMDNLPEIIGADVSTPAPAPVAATGDGDVAALADDDE